MRAECLARIERVAQIVERVDQADHPAQAADGGLAQALRVAAAVAVFVVLLDDPQHFVVEHQLLAVAHAELAVQLQQLLFRAGQRLALEQHLAGNLQLADVVQQGAQAQAVAGLGIEAELAAEHHRQHGDVERMQIGVLGGLAVDAVQGRAVLAAEGADQFADHFAGLLDGLFRLAAQGLIE